jgi:glucosylceramidase
MIVANCTYLCTGAVVSGIFLSDCQLHKSAMQIEAFETSADGRNMEKVAMPVFEHADMLLLINPDITFQSITGIGGSFTQAAAHVYASLGPTSRDKLMEAYFGEQGARYSLTRTHINSCDFSLDHYSYAPVPDDTQLFNFSIEKDRSQLIPMIKDAQRFSRDGFRIIASPWTAPPWMKDNNHWVGGRLKPEYYDTWASFFVRYLDAYEAEGISIWGLTVENEPLGNGDNWESMHYSPEEMNRFVKKYLGPKLINSPYQPILLGYDQNRGPELIQWVDAMYDDPEAAAFYGGTAIHWYGSTFDYFPEALDYTKVKAPNKHLIQTEACIDAQVPRWKEDTWYWSKEATDWGWLWASEAQRHKHPKYVPVFRYAQDIIGCLNHGVDGWIDWNMVLNRQGGPNWAKNWCIAPVIADTENDELYFTPLYYIMCQFSRFIRPGSKRIDWQINTNSIQTTAVRNLDGSIVVLLCNPEEYSQDLLIKISNQTTPIRLREMSIQTVVLKPTHIITENLSDVNT